MGAEHWLAEYDPLQPNSYAETKARLSSEQKAPVAASCQVEQTVRRKENPRSLSSDAVDDDIVLKPAIHAMMKKMGYVHGRGLGATSQGRVAPVGAEGNEGREGLGKAVLKSFSPKRQKSLPSMARKPPPSKMRAPVSQTLVIRNVADSCVAELEQECSVFGQFTIVKSDEGGAAERMSSVGSESRILVTFRDVSSSTRAALALQGMKLGGSSVRVSVHTEKVACIDEEV